MMTNCSIYYILVNYIQKNNSSNMEQHVICSTPIYPQIHKNYVKHSKSYPIIIPFSKELPYFTYFVILLMANTIDSCIQKYKINYIIIYAFNSCSMTFMQYTSYTSYKYMSKIKHSFITHRLSHSYICFGDDILWDTILP